MLTIPIEENINIKNGRSKKNKTALSGPNKAELWNIFETEVKNPDKQKDPLECLYRAIKNRENCEMCQSALVYSDEGFLTCTNEKCGIIYKDILDHSPESSLRRIFFRL